MDEEIRAYLAEQGLDGIIRIPEGEYTGFPQGGYFAHFNLERTNIELGKRYALPRILTHGSIDAQGREVLPVLSFQDIYRGECLEVRNNITYKALVAADFLDSFTHIKNIDELKYYILGRYEKSKPMLRREEILDLGVSRTFLRLSRVE
jgi:hypothetical protein